MNIFNKNKTLYCPAPHKKSGLLVWNLKAAPPTCYCSAVQAWQKSHEARSHPLLCDKKSSHNSKLDGILLLMKLQHTYYKKKCLDLSKKNCYLFISEFIFTFCLDIDKEWPAAVIWGHQSYFQKRLCLNKKRPISSEAIFVSTSNF